MSARKYKNGEVALMADAMRRDPLHKDIDPLQFVREPLTEHWVWDGEDGEPVLFFRLSRCLRVDIQFIPELQGRVTAKALTDGLAWLVERAKAAGFRELIFDSVYPPLISYMDGLGFKAIEPGTYRKWLYKVPGISESLV